jgi:hypothetical protein
VGRCCFPGCGCSRVRGKPCKCTLRCGQAHEPPAFEPQPAELFRLFDILSIDNKVDVYSYGVLLWELCTGGAYLPRCVACTAGW